VATNCSRTGTGTESNFQNLNLVLFFSRTGPFFLWNLNWIQFIFLKNWNQSFFIQDKNRPTSVHTSVGQFSQEKDCNLS